MKKSIVLLSTFFVAVLFMSSCIIKDKNAKIEGEWKLTSASSTRIHTTPSGTSSITTTTNTTYNGTMVSYTGGGTNGSYSYSETLTINDDGTYKLETIDDGAITTDENYWFWLDSNKNKEAFSLGDNGTFVIESLSTKEMVVVANTSTKTIEGIHVSSDIITSTNTYEKQ